MRETIKATIENTSKWHVFKPTDPYKLAEVNYYIKLKFIIILVRRFHTWNSKSKKGLLAAAG